MTTKKEKGFTLVRLPSLRERSCKGFTLVEVMLAVAAVIFLGFLVMSLPSAISSINRSRHTSIAKDIASRQIEKLREQTYANLANGTSSFTDSDLDSLNQSSASYEIEDCPSSVCTDIGVYKLKQVKASVSWNELGDNKKVEMTTLVGEGGIGQ